MLTRGAHGGCFARTCREHLLQLEVLFPSRPVAVPVTDTSEHDVYMPIAEQMDLVCNQGQSPTDAYRGLLRHEVRDEQHRA